jgi:S1-C subfamily serine protease
MRKIMLPAALLVACATVREAPPLAVQDHWYEVPRAPHPLYLRDGVQVVGLEGDSVWTRAGLLVNDVIESVNGEATPDTAAFRKAVGNARKVRITSTRRGPVGSYRLVALEASA